ncbi:hypothetical protein ACROYT_G005340 [Oculina patagonica]
MLFSHGSPNSCGTAILINNKANCTVLSTTPDPSGRFIISKIQVDDKVYVLVNIYAPNKDKDSVQFFNKLHTLLQTENLDSEENIILGGDFNCPLNPTLDKRGGIMIPRKSVVSSIECLQNELDLIDIWRVQNPQTKSFTWSQNSPTVLCRLDFWLISNNLCDFVNSTDIIPAIRTDHAAISLILGKVGEIKGPGMWKMNVTLLDDEEYLNYLSVNIPKWKSEGEKELSNKRSVWDWIKYNIRKHNIKYSKDKAKQRIDKERIIQQEYKEATRQFENDPSDLNRCCLNEIKEKLELLYEEKTKGIIVRARARWHEHEERSTKYFLNLEKRNHVKKHIRKLLISGAITTDPYRILTEQKNFYHNLYKTSSTDTDSIKSFLDNLNIPQLSEDQKQSCEGQITIDECKRILETFQNNKSPGNDGIPIEFYKSCWNLICEPFINCVNESFENEEMSNSQKQAVITLIEKQGKDRTLMENWRPISLVNVDAKIISKVIASRLKVVLPHIIHCNQTGYVKDRYIGETVRSILDIIDFTERENIPGLLIFIDFRKAFDTLEWNFLFKCLDAFNFGPEFKRWISTFYKNIQSCVINNGMSSEYFNLTRGVRQGDPLSPYLFLLAVESLAIAVRENEEIKGIAIERQETKLLQYADDTTAVLSDIESAQKLFQLLDKFRKLSGLKVNSSKTEGLWLGSLKGNEMKPLGIKWPQDPIKALGIFFTYDKKLLYLKNFSEKLDKIKKLINIWSSRGLSLYGKVTIIKTLLLPKVVYISSLLPTPENIIKELNQLIYKFLWKGKDKVTRVSAINNYEEGGIKMVDIESTIKSLRLSWMKRIFSDNSGTWKKYLEYLLTKEGGFYLFNCNYNIKDLTINSQFYRELLKWWSEFRTENAADTNWKNLIWNNHEIRINNKPVFYKRYFNYGIRTVEDLRFDLDNIDSYELLAKHIEKTNFLEWTGLRLSVPPNLRNTNFVPDYAELNPSFKIDGCLFDVTKKKSKDYYSLFVRKKARFPNIAQKLKCKFNLSDEALKKAFFLPHSVAFEPYVKAFQFKSDGILTAINIQDVADPSMNDSCKCARAPQANRFPIRWKIVNFCRVKDEVLELELCRRSMNIRKENCTTQKKEISF